MVILGIDPGLANTGWGVVECVNQRYRPVSFGVIRTDTAHSLPDRIHAIAQKIGEIADRFSVECVSIEDIYFAQNVSSSIAVAKVIGACTHELKGRGLDVQYFSPMQIKMAITGIGRADKNQVQQMVALLLKMDKVPRPDHAADALADCITYAVMNQTKGRLGGILK
ncbi:MAG: crossover junction endodeoxyribonuclease RuvC [Spirochaetes bacterium]|uniref:Crossover junction endodeoxyribonuclease RuvC n=1 Tax=Candidatus Aphodenecus pullistercoris TaxID=2840669 RepID=A0A9D9EAG1_9SPIR|nr:crossover junction endodeoxyribonuclease RuvC [Candidatus Aphodenecus pullistercoris]